jgi:hypothetical protein
MAFTFGGGQSPFGAKPTTTASTFGNERERARKKNSKLTSLSVFLQ